MKQSFLLLGLAVCTSSAKTVAQNFGIGTTSPATRLHVVSDGAGSSTADDIELASYNAAPSPYFIMKTARGSVSTPADLSNGDNLGVVAYSGRVGGGFAELAALKASYDGNGTTRNAAFRFLFDGAERVHINSAGLIGIGTTTPTAALSIVNDASSDAADNIGISTYSVSHTPALLMHRARGTQSSPSNLQAGDGLGGFQFRGQVNGGISTLSAIEGRYTGNGTTNSSALIFKTANAERMFISGDGFVGIGTGTPRVPLEVGTSTLYNFGNFGFLNPSGSVGNAAAGASSMSIYTVGRIGCSEFNAFSDARLKNVVGRADGAEDLSTLRAIRITNYTMRDRVEYGDKQHRKLIAQELEEVYPTAVSKTQGFVPTIYAKASISTAQGSTIITTPSAHGLKVGDKVRLIGEVNGKVETEVLSISGNSFTAALPKAESALFVYCPEVNDLRTVDYEAIAMLNVSATQELDKKVAALESQIISLAAENDTLRKEAVAYAELAGRVKELQLMLGVNPESAGAKMGKK